MKYNKQDITAICISTLLLFALSFLYSSVNIEKRLFVCVVFGILLLVGKGFSNKWLNRTTERTSE
jgi:hypothetical protein